MRDTEEECGTWDKRREESLDAGCEKAPPNRWCALLASPHSAQHPAFLFRIPHRGEIPHPAFLFRIPHRVADLSRLQHCLHPPRDETVTVRRRGRAIVVARMSPTVLRARGFRLYFWSDEESRTKWQEHAPH